MEPGFSAARTTSAAVLLDGADDIIGLGGAGGSYRSGENRLIGRACGCGLGASRTVFMSEPDGLGISHTS